MIETTTVDLSADPRKSSLYDILETLLIADVKKIKQTNKQKQKQKQKNPKKRLHEVLRDPQHWCLDRNLNVFTGIVIRSVWYQ